MADDSRNESVEPVGLAQALLRRFSELGGVELELPDRAPIDPTDPPDADQSSSSTH